MKETCSLLGACDGYGVAFRRPVGPERCLSGRKSTIGNRVCPERGIEGSNPSLSATSLSLFAPSWR